MLGPYGAVVAAMQKDLKRLVAYSSVAHLGFIVLGTFAFTTQGLSGGVLQMVNHGISTGALFLLVGMIYERRHTRQIAEIVWKAVHGKKVHWVPGLLLKTLNYLGGALPFVSRPTMRMVDRRRG